MLEQHTASINAAEEAIETKADGSLVVDVQTVGEELELIKEHLKREEDQGINVIDISNSYNIITYLAWIFTL